MVSYAAVRSAAEEVRLVMKRSLACVLLLFCTSFAAHAVDGVLEINQACALNTGCFAGDAAGLPVSITTSGSYRLTSDLTVPDVNTDGISISTSNVSVDLNGFGIIRSGCEGAVPLCSLSVGSGSGVEAAATTLRSLSVRNGSVLGMGSSGVELALQSEVTGVRIGWNGVDGVRVLAGSVVSAVAAYANGADGIHGEAEGVSVTKCVAYDNVGDGIEVTAGSTVSMNTAYDNDADGILVGDGCTVLANTVYQNGGDGIDASTGSNVRGNTAMNNLGFGLDLGASYRENTIRGNGLGAVNGGINMFSNSCDGAVTCN
jgi:parallel beta-helix repeat protein